MSSVSSPLRNDSYASVGILCSHISLTNVQTSSFNKSASGVSLGTVLQPSHNPGPLAGITWAELFASASPLGITTHTFLGNCT
jgi:hypothetical protein